MKALGSSSAHRCVSVRDGEGGTKCLSIPHDRELCISSVKHSHVKCGRESEGTVVLLTEKRASQIYPEQKRTSHVWIRLRGYGNTSLSLKRVDTDNQVHRNNPDSQ